MLTRFKYSIVSKSSIELVEEAEQGGCVPSQYNNVESIEQLVWVKMGDAIKVGTDSLPRVHQTILINNFHTRIKQNAD